MVVWLDSGQNYNGVTIKEVKSDFFVWIDNTVQYIIWKSKGPYIDPWGAPLVIALIIEVRLLLEINFLISKVAVECLIAMDTCLLIYQDAFQFNTDRDPFIVVELFDDFL